MGDKHTPGPWRREQNMVVAGDHICIAELLNGSSQPYTEAGDREAKANAALIVRAVNCHEELVTMVKDLIDTFQFELGHKAEVLAPLDSARAVLAKVEDEGDG